MRLCHNSLEPFLNLQPFRHIDPSSPVEISIKDTNAGICVEDSEENETRSDNQPKGVLYVSSVGSMSFSS